MQKILTTSNLSKNYGGLTALNGLSMNVHKGDIYGILGPNGSGKTTTLGIALGVTNQSNGNYSWFEEGASHELRKRVGALLEKPNFYPHLNAIQNLKIVADIKDVKNPEIDNCMSLCGVDQYANRKFYSYSTGMKQRLAVAATLLGSPEVLVLDEPTNGLDPEGIADIRNLIIKIGSEGTTVIMASHLLDEVQKVCSHVCVLKKGKKLFEGQVTELLAGKEGIEIRSDDMTRLEGVLAAFEGVDQINKENDLYRVRLKPGFKSSELSAFLIKNGIDITHYAQSSGSLEKEFIQLLSNNGS